MAVSVRDVAVAASVSVGTVSNVLNRPEKVSAATVARVHAAIEELGFVRNDAARQLRAGRSRSLGLVVLDVGNPFFAEVARGADARAASEGITVLVGSSDEDADREAAYLDLFREQRVNGVLLTPVQADAARLERLRMAGVPVVLVDAELAPADGAGSVPSVSVDDIEGGFLAASHLLATGRRRLAFVGGSLEVRQVSDRLDGARRAVAECDGARLEVIERPSLTVLEGRSVGEQLAARAEPGRPDAVFCANDLLAVGMLQGLSILGGVRVPEDIALIGYDDIDFASTAVVPLSSIRQPAREIGAAAVELLMEVIAEPESAGRAVRFIPELVVRASTASG
ncbi:LacI family DNA-binding transcriptional regulator [Microbacterium alcoholitolerans]|uniref:LacI family DNA-binding transcriptional regulator n=1 Tax=unclassified Microbacterium TaxID=2609290 RepID=UPI003D164393